MLMGLPYDASGTNVSRAWCYGCLIRAPVRFYGYLLIFSRGRAILQLRHYGLSL